MIFEEVKKLSSTFIPKYFLGICINIEIIKIDKGKPIL